MRIPTIATAKIRDMSDVKIELVEYAKSQAGTRLGRTIAALTRSDKDRIEFWPGSAVFPHATVERMDEPGDLEAVVIAAAGRFGELRAAIGFVMCEDAQPTASAWLVLNGVVIDPARNRRALLGCYGVELRESERSNWTPSQPSAVAERDAHRQRVAA